MVAPNEPEPEILLIAGSAEAQMNWLRMRRPGGLHGRIATGGASFCPLPVPSDKICHRANVMKVEAVSRVHKFTRRSGRARFDADISPDRAFAAQRHS